MRSAEADKMSAGTGAVVQERPAQWQARIAAWLLRPSVLLRVSMLLLAGLYLRSITFDFVYDDLTLLVNPWMESWKSVPDIFTHDIFGFPGRGPHSVYYRPLPVLMVLAVRQLTGGAPGMYHLLALLLHLVVFYLAFELGRLLLRDERLSLFAALLFALHPTKAESVAWIGSSMSDATSGALFCATLIYYLRWQERKRRAWLALSVLSFMAALFSKETMLVAPAVIAVHFWLSEGAYKRAQRLLALLLPYAFVLTAYMYVRHLVLSSTGTNYVPPSLAGVWSAPLVCWWYAKHLLWPVALSVVYDPVIVTAPTLRDFYAPALGLALVCAASLWWWNRRRNANAVVLGCWFLLALAPSIVMSLMVRQHDRYMYLAGYPFCVLIAYLLLRAGSYKQQARIGIAVALILFYAVGTWRQTTAWESSLSLWTQAVQNAPKAIEPRVQLAYFYTEASDSETALRVIDEGLQINPVSPSLWQTRGEILFEKKRYIEAREALLNVMQAGNDFRGKAASAFHLGQIDLADARFDSAESWLRQAIALDGDNASYHRSLADALTHQGRLEEAAEEKRIAVAVSKRAFATRITRAR